jgi:hypothetical protein
MLPPPTKTISKIITCRGEGTKGGNIAVADSEQLTSNLTQASLLNLSCQEGHLPSTTEEYNRIKVNYGEVDGVTAVVGDAGLPTFTASVPPQFNSATVDNAASAYPNSWEITCGKPHGLDGNILDFVFHNSAVAGSTITHTSSNTTADWVTSALVGEVNGTTFGVIHGYPTDSPTLNLSIKFANRSKAYNVTKINATDLEFDNDGLVLNSPAESASVFYTSSTLDVPNGTDYKLYVFEPDVAGARKGFVCPITAMSTTRTAATITSDFSAITWITGYYRAIVSLPIAVDGTPYEGNDDFVGGRTMNLLDTNMVVTSATKLLRFSTTTETLATLGSEEPATLVSTPLMMSDVPGAMNKQLKKKYFINPEVDAVVFENRKLTSAYGRVVQTPAADAAGGAMVTIPPAFYEGQLGTVGGEISAGLSRFFLPSSATFVAAGVTVTVPAGRYYDVYALTTKIVQLLEAAASSGTGEWVVIISTTTSHKSYGGTGSWCSHVDGSATPFLPAAEDTRPLFRKRGEQAADATTTKPYRPAAYQVTLKAPSTQITFDFTLTSLALRQVLGVEAGVYPGGIALGSQQRSYKGYGVASVAINLVKRKFTLGLGPDTINVGVTEQASNTAGILITLQIQSLTSFAVEVGEVVEVRQNPPANYAAVTRAVVTEVTPVPGLTDKPGGFVFKLAARLAGSASVDLGKTQPVTITRLRGSAGAELDLAGFPEWRYMSLAPLLGTKDVFKFRIPTAVPYTIATSPTSCFVRLLPSEHAQDTQQTHSVSTQGGVRDTAQHTGGRVGTGAKEWVGAPAHFPLTWPAPIRSSELMLSIRYIDSTPMDLTGMFFVGTVALNMSARHAI